MQACSNTNPFDPPAQLDCSAWTATKTVTPQAQDTTPPGVPRNVQLAPSYSYVSNSLILTWQAPASWNGTPVGYEIDWYKGATAPAADSTDWKQARPTGGGFVVSGTATSYWFPSDRERGASPPVTVAYGAKYHFRIRAVRVNPNDANDPFVSSWVIVSATYTHSHGPAPGKPVPTEVTAAAGATTLSFSIPCVTPGSGPVTDYTVGFKKSDGSGSEDFWVHEFTLAEYNANRSCPTTTVRLTGLTPETAYTFRARARNILGRRSEWSGGVDATTPQMFLGGGSNDPDRKDALTASFEQVPAAHNGKDTFDLLVRLSETIGNFSKSPRASSFEVTQGSVVMVEQADAGLWRVRIRPSSSSQVGVTLAGGRDCDTEGAVCTRDIRALSNTVTATVEGPPAEAPQDQQQQQVLGAGDVAGAVTAEEPVASQRPPGQLYDSLLADVREWRNDPQWVSYKAHTDRWDRVLLALGEPVSDVSLTPMTVAEAQGFANKGWTRWQDMPQVLQEVVTGTSGANTLRGTANGDLLVGLGGPDALRGLQGEDELRGGDGNDTYTGGEGRDRFVFFPGETGANAITDFASGDVVVLKGNGWSSVADIIASVQAIGSASYRYTLASGLTVETTNNRPLRTEDFVTE